MGEFLKYWLQCFYIGWRFGYGLFSYIAGLCLLISTGLFIFKKYNKRSWKNWEQFIMKTAFYLFIVSFIIATFLVAPFLQYRQNKPTSENTKQEIRSFLETVNPEILKRIDVGRKEILVCISTQDAVRLSNLSEYVDFNKYLSFRQATIGEDDSKGLEDPNIFIENNEYLWATNGYYLYPKDALMR